MFGRKKTPEEKEISWWLDRAHIEATSVKFDSIDGMSIEEYNETPLQYIMIYDQATFGKKLKNMIKAINILCLNGWNLASYNEYRDIEKFGSMGGIRGQALLEKAYTNS